MNINNLLENKIRELNERGITSFEYEALYENIGNEKIRDVFSLLHGGYINLFRRLNERLPTSDYVAHFWAEESRNLIFVIDFTFELQSVLKKTELAFSIDESYHKIITHCRDFLSKSGGSTIPPHTEKIELYYLEPIFQISESITKNCNYHQVIANLKLIGEGSYAKVFCYKDEFYDKDFVLKRAKSDLTEKELQRFKREFEEMKRLNSPYIVDVYSYNEDKHEYIMELMDFSLEKYVSTHNQSLTLQERRDIIMQLLKAYNYLHSKNVFHRDISPRNVLIKKYDDVLVVKISDFGLVKIVGSDLTSENTDFKGSLNDPALKVEGFGNYGLLHELYAITLLFAYIMTGKSNWANIKDPNIKSFMEIGTNPNKEKRFQTLDALEESVNKCLTAMETQRS